MGVIPSSVGLNIQVKETDRPLLERICGLYASLGLAGRAYLTVSTFTDAEVDETPGVSVPNFDMVYDDMKDKKNEVFWKYVLGELSFDQMMNQFEDYKKEINFDDILKQINDAEM